MGQEVGDRGLGSGIGLIRLGSAEKTTLGLGIKHWPRLRRLQSGQRMSGDFEIDTRVDLYSSSLCLLLESGP